MSKGLEDWCCVLFLNPKKFIMQLLKYGIGIDMAKDKFDVCVSTIDTVQQVKTTATRSFDNTLKGFETFLTWIGKKCTREIPRVFLMEATGIYYEQLAWYLYQKDQQLSVILPNKAKRYKQSLGLKSKNDAIDAQGLSRMTCEQHLRRWHPLSKNIYQLRLLTRQSERLSSFITQFNNQLKAVRLGMYRDKSIEKMMERNILSFKKQKEQLEARIESLITEDELLKERCEQICAIKGVGLLTFAVIVAETNGFALIENQAQLVSYAGYDVVENQSGNHAGRTRISKKGNSHIRRALHMPALNMVTYEQAPFANLYERIYDRSKIKMKGYTAIQKKLLVIMYTLWKKQETYDPKYVNSLAKALENTSPEQLKNKQPNTKAGLHKMNAQQQVEERPLSF